MNEQELEWVDVNSRTMYEFSDALLEFERAIAAVGERVGELTRELRPAMQKCSRYDAVCAETAEAVAALAAEAAELDRVNRDLLERAEVVLYFERTPFEG